MVGLFTAVFCSILGTTNTSGDYLWVGTGAELLPAATRPIARGSYTFNLGASFDVTDWLEGASALDLTVVEAGPAKRLFLGRVYEMARVGWSVLDGELRLMAQGGGGIYFSRHSQILLGKVGLDYGPVVGFGPVINYMPLINKKYVWSSMTLQVQGIYWKYFSSPIIRNTISMVIGFGGTF